jgi:hypothetical protein
LPTRRLVGELGKWKSEVFTAKNTHGHLDEFSTRYTGGKGFNPSSASIIHNDAGIDYA